MSRSVPRRSRKFGGDMPREGLPSMDVEIYGETFKVRGAMSGLRLMSVMGALDGEDEDGDGASAMDTILKFLSDAFLKEDRARAMEFLEFSDPPVTFTMLVEIIQWLVEQYTGNPTEPSEDSQSGSQTNGSGSSENAQSPDATSATLTDTNSSPLPPHLQPVQ